jgi:hypothetical protein
MATLSAPQVALLRQISQTFGRFDVPVRQGRTAQALEARGMIVTINPGAPFDRNTLLTVEGLAYLAELDGAVAPCGPVVAASAPQEPAAGLAPAPAPAPVLAPASAPFAVGQVVRFWHPDRGHRLGRVNRLRPNGNLLITWPLNPHGNRVPRIEVEPRYVLALPAGTDEAEAVANEARADATAEAVICPTCGGAGGPDEARPCPTCCEPAPAGPVVNVDVPGLLAALAALETARAPASTLLAVALDLTGPEVEQDLADARANLDASIRDGFLGPDALGALTAWPADDPGVAVAAARTTIATWSVPADGPATCDSVLVLPGPAATTDAESALAEARALVNGAAVWPVETTEAEDALAGQRAALALWPTGADLSDVALELLAHARAKNTTITIKSPAKIEAARTLAAAGLAKVRETDRPVHRAFVRAITP